LARHLPIIPITMKKHIPLDLAIAHIEASNTGVGLHVAELQAESHSPSLVVVDLKKERDDTFFVNGVEYEPIVSEKSSTKTNRSSKINALAIMAQMAYMPLMVGMGGGKTNYRRELPPKLNLISEYGLIQEKKSNLSKWEREEVVFRFEKLFRKVLKS
jgi:hypothetical protein